MLARMLLLFACIALAVVPAAPAGGARIRWVFDLVEAPAIDSPQVSLLARQELTTDERGNAELTYADPTDGRFYRLVFRDARILPSGMIKFDLHWLEEGSGVLRQRFAPIAVDGSFWLTLYRQEGQVEAATKVFLRCSPAPER